MMRESAYDIWNTHVDKWVTFLNRRLSDFMTDDPEGNRGDIVRLERQLRALYNIRYGVVAAPALFETIIHPESIPACAGRGESTFYNGNLNASQQEAVNKALGAERLCLIQGPPGTGKTTVITEICMHILLGHPESRILICSETHVAVNNVLERLYDEFEDLNVLRVNNRESNLNEDIDGASVEAVLADYQATIAEVVGHNIADQMTSILAGNLSLTARDLIRSRRVVGITCNGIGAHTFPLLTQAFDYVIIDEVSKATLPEILMPLTVAKKAILVGDPAQLPPLFCYEDRDAMQETDTHEVEDYKYVDQLFERVPSTGSAMLTEQFRMTNEIGGLISTFFYGGQLKNGLDRSDPDSALWITYTASQLWPLQYGDPIYNLDELEVIFKILENAHRRLKTEKRTVAIISPYRPQVGRIRQRLGYENYPNFDVVVDTVDAFQGKDADYVIFSVTRNTGSMRFFSDPRRLNVALSRAKERLWVVGSTDYTDGNELLKRMSRGMRRIHADSITA